MLDLLFAASMVAASVPTPPPVLVDDGACPSECCTYGTWTARTTFRALANPSAHAPAIATLRKGTSVAALTGYVWTRAGRFVVSRAHESYKVGDVIFVYTYKGEGFFKVWFHGRLYDEDLGFSPYGGTPGNRCEASSDCWGQLTAAHRSDWWIKLRLPDGRIGWTREPHRFSGKDRCS